MNRFTFPNATWLKPVLIGLTACLTVACGQKGPLYLPEQPEVKSEAETGQQANLNEQKKSISSDTKEEPTEKEQ